MHPPIASLETALCGSYTGDRAVDFAGGSRCENRIGPLLSLIHISPEENGQELLRAIRAAGYGVTALTGHGLKGEKMVLMVSAQRKSLPRLTAIIEEFAPNSFMTVLETRAVRGGITPFRNMK